VDGFGSNVETNSIYVADKKGIRLVDKAYGQGIGLVYEVVTSDILGFKRGQEGKTMGLAAFGRNIKGKKILNLNPTFDGIITDYSEFIDRAPRERLKQKLPKCPSVKDVTNEFYSKVAFELQEEAERCFLHLAHYAYKKTKKKKLCIAGGVGLNCLANSRIIEKGPFDEVFIQPACADDGLSFGLALYGYSQYKKPKIKFSVYTGKTYDMSETEELLHKENIPYKKSNPREVAELISRKNIIGWFVGGSELGPRALGHRSILADPRSMDIKDIINSKVKHREMYRPFAPSVLEEDAKEYFDLDCPSPHMLLAPMTKKNKMASIPAVVHVDGLARVQTVSKDDRAYYDVIKAFKDITGIPVVLNTSFNDDEEPIVETPVDNILCFLKTNIDYLYIDGLLIDKKKVDKVEEKILSLESFRRNKLKKEYTECVKLLTSGYSTKEMKNYLKSQYSAWDYYNHQHTFMTLKTALHQELAGRKYFITDQYHFDMIQRFLKEEFYLINRHKIIIVEDCLKNLKKVKADSFALLFNLSLYIKDKTVFNFYKDRSMLRLRVPYNMEDKAEADLSHSNEYNLSKDWDRFYKEYVLS
jgi:carbamoyltransferase